MPEIPEASEEKLAQVDYGALDKAKLRLVEFSRQTVAFAERYGKVGNPKLGASANIFNVDLQRFLKVGATKLQISLLPEGVGTADDARPPDLTPDELRQFYYHIAFKEMSALTNDAASAGLDTVLVSTYLPTSTPETVFTAEVIEGFGAGMVEACRKIGCVYFSGETPELRGKIEPGKLDVAGALVAVVPPGQRAIDSRELRAGDQIVLVESAGVHENGFTGFRALAADLPGGYRTKLPSGREYWDVLNDPSKLYTPFVQAVMREGIRPSNIEPISGHGWQKLMRPRQPLRYVIEETLPPQEIFEFIREQTGASLAEMLRKLNMGVGQAVFVHERAEAEAVADIATAYGLQACVGGGTHEAERRTVEIKPYGVTLDDRDFALTK